MAGRSLKDLIRGKLSDLEIGTQLFARKGKHHLLQLTVVAIKGDRAVCEYTKSQKRFVFSLITGTGIENAYRIVACGEKGIAEFNAEMARRGEKRTQRKRLRTIEGRATSGETTIPRGSLSSLAIEVGRRVAIHFEVAQFDACKEIIDSSSAQYRADQEALRQAIFDHGVGHPLSVLPMSLQLANSLELHGFHDISQFCNAGRDYLLMHVPQFTEKRLEACCRMLSRLGFEHVLHEAVYSKEEDAEVPVAIPIEAIDEEIEKEDKKLLSDAA